MPTVAFTNCLLASTSFRPRPRLGHSHCINSAQPRFRTTYFVSSVSERSTHIADSLRPSAKGVPRSVKERRARCIRKQSSFYACYAAPMSSPYVSCEQDSPCMTWECYGLGSRPERSFQVPVAFGAAIERAEPKSKPEFGFHGIK